MGPPDVPRAYPGAVVLPRGDDTADLRPGPGRVSGPPTAGTEGRPAGLRKHLVERVGVPRKSGGPSRTHRGATSSEAATWLAESAESELVGMAGIFWEKGSFAVWGMWVDPRRRGTGIGTRLLQEVLRWAATARPEASVRLSVNPTQSAAVRLYRTCGFRSTGKSDPLGHTPGAFVEEMVRPSQGSRTSA